MNTSFATTETRRLNPRDSQSVKQMVKMIGDGRPRVTGWEAEPRLFVG